MKPCEWRTPIFHDPYDGAILDCGLDVKLWHKGNAETRLCGFDRKGGRVAGKLSLNPYLDLTSFLLELPRINPPVRRRADIDASVIGQIVR